MNKLSSVFKKILFWCADIILPPSEIEAMTPEEFAEKAGNTAKPENLPSYIQALFSYKNPLARRAIWELKYRGNRKIASLLGELLYEEMIAEASEMGLWGKQTKIVVIPIPSSPKRFREKGFNQTFFLCDAIRKLDADAGKIFSIDAGILTKTQETKTQVSIRNRDERLKNLKGAFSAGNFPEKISGATIFLIDDVTTTGATLSEARNTLLKSGAKKVSCFAVAH